MSDQPENLILVYLRRLDEKLDRVFERLDDLTHRVTSPELKVSLLHNDFARQSDRMDRIEVRLERIERRFDIVGAAE